MIDLIGAGRIVMICFITGFSVGVGYGLAHWICKKYNLL